MQRYHLLQHGGFVIQVLGPLGPANRPNGLAHPVFGRHVDAIPAANEIFVGNGQPLRRPRNARGNFDGRIVALEGEVRFDGS